MDACTSMHKMHKIKKKLCKADAQVASAIICTKKTLRMAFYQRCIDDAVFLSNKADAIKRTCA